MQQRGIPEYMRWEVIEEDGWWLVMRNGEWHSDGPQGREVFARFVNEAQAVNTVKMLENR